MSKNYNVAADNKEARTRVRNTKTYYELSTSCFSGLISFALKKRQKKVRGRGNGVGRKVRTSVATKNVIEKQTNKQQKRALLKDVRGLIACIPLCFSHRYIGSFTWSYLLFLISCFFLLLHRSLDDSSPPGSLLPTCRYYFNGSGFRIPWG